MGAGGHFSYFIVQLIAQLEQSDCSIRVFQSKITIYETTCGCIQKDAGGDDKL